MTKISSRQLLFFLAVIAPLGKMIIMPAQLVVFSKNDLLLSTDQCGTANGSGISRRICGTAPKIPLSASCRAIRNDYGKNCLLYPVFVFAVCGASSHHGTKTDGAECVL